MKQIFKHLITLNTQWITLHNDAIGYRFHRINWLLNIFIRWSINNNNNPENKISRNSYSANLSYYHSCRQILTTIRPNYNKS